MGGIIPGGGGLIIGGIIFIFPIGGGIIPIYPGIIGGCPGIICPGIGGLGIPRIIGIPRPGGAIPIG